MYNTGSSGLKSRRLMTLSEVGEGYRMDGDESLRKVQIGVAGLPIQQCVEYKMLQ